MGRVVVGSNLGPGKVFQQLSLRYTLPTTSLVHSLKLIIRETNFFFAFTPAVQAADVPDSQTKKPTVISKLKKFFVSNNL